jgi:hypothetical protein
MGERTDQIERHIAQTRSELSDNVGELQDKVKSAVDWRTQFQEHPGTFLAVAFGGGAVLSALLPSSNHSRTTHRNAPPQDSATNEPASSNAATRKPNELRRSIDAFTGALVGVAVKQASGFLDSLLPGFHQEFTKAKDKNSRGDSPIDVAAATDSASPESLSATASA